MMNISEELMAKARAAKSVEELLALAKENDVELTEEKANYYFQKMNQSGELEDDELDSVAGGGCREYYLRVNLNDRCHFGYYRWCNECWDYNDGVCYNRKLK